MTEFRVRRGKKARAPDHHQQENVYALTLYGCRGFTLGHYLLGTLARFIGTGTFQHQEKSEEQESGIAATYNNNLWTKNDRRTGTHL